MTAFSSTRPARRAILAIIAATAVASAAAPPVLAHDFRAGSLTIDHPTITPTRGQVRVHGGYMTIVNAGRTPDRLLSASSPRAGRVELHTHIREADVMRMRKVEGGIAIPAGQTVRFQRGGLHLMFFDVTGTVAEGDAIPVTLVFERAGRVEVVAKGEAPGGSAGGAHRH